MGEAVRDSAADFSYIFRERELGHDDGIVGNVIDLGFEVDAGMIVVEGNAADESPATVK